MFLVVVVIILLEVVCGGFCCGRLWFGCDVVGEVLMLGVCWRFILVCDLGIFFVWLVYCEEVGF